MLKAKLPPVENFYLFFESTNVLNLKYHKSCELHLQLNFKWLYLNQIIKVKN